MTEHYYRRRILASFQHIIDELLWDTTRSLVARLDTMLRFSRVSRGLTEFLAHEGMELLGRNLFEFMPDLLEDEIEMILKHRNFERSIHRMKSVSGPENVMAVLEADDKGAVLFVEKTISQSASSRPRLRPVPDDPQLLREIEDLRLQNSYLEALNQRIRREHILSSASGFFKRKVLDQFCDAEIARSIRSGRPFALLLCGVDRAQAIGQMTDEESMAKVVTVVAKAISTRKRVFDLIGHFSPSELYIVQPENEIGGATEFAERIRTAIKGRKVRLDKFEFSLTLSFGVSYFHPQKNHYRDRAEMISQTEAAIFASASSGGDRITQAPLAGVIAREVPIIGDVPRVKK